MWLSKNKKLRLFLIFQENINKMSIQNFRSLIRKIYDSHGWPRARPNALHPLQYGGNHLERACLKNAHTLHLAINLNNIYSMHQFSWATRR
jgi:hypothetical protein